MLAPLTDSGLESTRPAVVAAPDTPLRRRRVPARRTVHPPATVADSQVLVDEPCSAWSL